MHFARTLAGFALLAGFPSPGETWPDIRAPEPQLARCLENALEANPGLLASRAESEAARERIPQRTALPDPTLQLTQAIRSVETRVGGQIGGITLSQSFPWFGARSLEGRIATAEAESASRLHEAAERQILVEAKRAFYEIAYLDEALRLAAEERSLLGHYETLARARYASGEGLQRGVIRLQAELSRVRDRELRYEGHRRALTAHLNTLCGRPPETEVAPIGPMELPEITLDRDELLALGEANRQEILAGKALARGNEDQRELATLDNRPRLTASLAYLNVLGRDGLSGLPPDNGKNALSISLGLTLPVWKEKYRAAAREAASRLTASRERLEEARDAVAHAVERSLARLGTLEEQIALLDGVLIPQSEEALRATEAAYETGQAGVLDLLDSERIQIDVRRMRARHLSDFLIALAELERGIGARVPEGHGEES